MRPFSSGRTLQRALVTFLLLISISSILFGNSVKAQTQVNVTVDSSDTISTNDYAVGFSLDHVMNDDERDFLYNPATRQLARDADFKMVRIVDFRNLQPCTRWYESSKTGTFNWADMDDLVQKIFEVGAEPLIVLGCFTGYNEDPLIPRGMAINWYTGLPYPESFAAYCAEWVRHFKSKGMPVRYYEIMNEAWHYFWDSWGETNTVKRKNFVTLLNTVYDRMRLVDNRALIGTDSSTLRSFLDYFVNYGRGLGFLSFHKYDSGSTWESDSSIFSDAKESRFETTRTFYSPETARQVWYNSRRVTLPVINSETNLSWLWKSGTDPRIQKMSGAVWTALMIRACITKGVQYSIYYRFLSSKSDERRKPTGGYGFGMVNSDNDQPWYPYYVHKMIGNNLEIGDRIVSSSSSRSEISPLAWINGNKLNILLICEVNYQRAIRLYGVSGQLSYFKVDNTVSWESPRIQTGVISSSNTFTLNGYTVILLQKETSEPPPPTTTGFADGFESGDFREWSGTYTTSGETVTVSTVNPHHGTYHGRFVSSGGGGVERAYCYKNIAATSALYVRGYVYIQTGLPLRDENDRFNIFAIQGATGQQVIASVSVQRSGGSDRWAVRSQAGAFFASTGPSTNYWYCIEFYTRISGTNGIHRLWINGQLVTEETGLNTAAEGYINQMRFGLTYLNGVTNNVNVYGDCFAVSDAYIGPEADSLFQDGFESGDFREWSGTYTTSGETVTVATYDPHHGTYHARFYSNGGGGTERAYVYEDVDDRSQIYVRAYVNINTGLPLSDENDRFNIIALRGDTRGWIVTNVIVQHTGGVDRWGVKSTSGTWFASTGPSMYRWYCVEIYLRVHPTEGICRLWIDGNKVIERTGLNTATEGYVDSIHFGLTYVNSVTRSVRFYCDCFVASDSYIGLES